MCTSITYRKKDHYFGRTLDVDFSFNETVVITPRNFSFTLHSGNEFQNKYALIGMGIVQSDTPMYYEASNEKGLAMAGLNFPKVSPYPSENPNKVNLTPGELIPWILGQAENLNEARDLLEKANPVSVTFNGMAIAPLHFMLSDASGCIVAEPSPEGLVIFDNPYDVMTNSPSFDHHLWNMQNYLNLSPKNRENTFSPSYKMGNYAVGMGALGLPGDVSSTSRFVRAAFNLTNSYSEDEEMANVTQFFHVLDSVSMVKGAAITDQGRYDITLYTCCINTTKGIYYYKTYDNNQITAIRLDHADLDADHLYVYPLRNTQQIFCEN